jgi:hypothetical protein
MPAEQIKPVMNMSRLAWLPGERLFMFDPTSLAMGTRRTLAIV